MVSSANCQRQGKGGFCVQLASLGAEPPTLLQDRLACVQNELLQLTDGIFLIERE